MHLMNYEIVLPANYDMSVIRERVSTRGAALDRFPGLGVKAYGIRECGVRAAPVNAYAPFYLWNTLDGMNAFLWGEGFRNLVRDFGRPVVRHWIGLGFTRGADWGRPVTISVRRRSGQPEGRSARFVSSGPGGGPKQRAASLELVVV